MKSYNDSTNMPEIAKVNNPKAVMRFGGSKMLVVFEGGLDLHSSFDYEDTVLCPECGAPKVHGMNCWEQLGALLGWEFDDPELQAEHFLTVACYNLQHPAQFTEHALNGLRAVFIDHLDNGLPVKEIRKRVSKTSEGKTRVLKEVTERYPVQRQWAMTIANVYTPSNPEGAAKRVKEWATVIRQEL